MTIKTEKENNCLKLILGGELNTLAAPEFEKAYISGKDGATEIVLDLEDLTYIT